MTRCLNASCSRHLTTGRHCLQACLDGGSEHVLLSNGVHFPMSPDFCLCYAEISNSVSSPAISCRLPPPFGVPPGPNSPHDVARPADHAAGVTVMSIMAERASPAAPHY